MDVLKLPTDNLYKFMAVTGVALVLLCLVLLNVSAERLAARTHELLAVTDSIYMSIEAIKESRDSSSLARAVERANALSLHSKVAAERASDDGFLERLRFWLLLGGLCVGSILIVQGFWLWHERLQKHEDARIAAEARLAVERLARRQPFE